LDLDLKLVDLDLAVVGLDTSLTVIVDNIDERDHSSLLVASIEVRLRYPAPFSDRIMFPTIPQQYANGHKQVSSYVARGLFVLHDGTHSAVLTVARCLSVCPFVCLSVRPAVTL